MLTPDLIAEYWAEVEKALKKHGLSEREAIRGIGEYRVRLERHGVGHILYHRDAEDVAQTIAAAVRNGGFKEPCEK